MNICRQCLMPETAESITFNESGLCSVCEQIEYKHNQIDWSKRAEQFSELVSHYRGKGQYDCLVPFSGGKDSCFTLWYLVKIMKLKPLVVRFDHGFLRDNVNLNCLKVCRKLGVDVHQFTPNWQVVKKLMYESLKRRGDFCWHCHTGIFAYPMWVAIEKNIPLIIWGEPTAEYASFYSYDEEEDVDERRFNSFVNLGINAEDMLGMLDNSVSDYNVTEADLIPFTYPPSEKTRELKSILLGSYIPWDVKKQVEIIKRELDWLGDEVEGVPPEYNYEKIECYMQGVRDYIKFLKRGFGRTTHLTSIDIRNKRISREEGLRLVNEYDGKRPYALDIFLNYLGISENQFMELIAPHVVAPHVMPACNECHKNINSCPPKDHGSWNKWS